jgi:macrolide-specific efflux system membrane fusion protein
VSVLLSLSPFAGYSAAIRWLACMAILSLCAHVVTHALIADYNRETKVGGSMSMATVNALTTPIVLSTILIALFLGSDGNDAPGATLAVEDVQVTLVADVQAPARQDGVLAALSVKEGDLVSQGAELGRLDSELAQIDERLARTELEISRLRAENDVDRRFAQKSLEVAKSELARSLESVTNFPKSISKTELDRLRLVVEKTGLSIEQSDRDLQEAALTKSLKRQTVDAARKRLYDQRISAPAAGMVVQVFRRPGEWLNKGDPVVRIIRLDRLRTEAFVDGTRFGANLIGCPLTLTTKLPPGDVVGRFQGRITFVSPEVQPVNGQVRVWAEVENPQLTLRPGVHGSLTIDISSLSIDNNLSAVRDTVVSGDHVNDRPQDNKPTARHSLP